MPGLVKERSGAQGDLFELVDFQLDLARGSTEDGIEERNQVIVGVQPQTLLILVHIVALVLVVFALRAAQADFTDHAIF